MKRAEGLVAIFVVAAALGCGSPRSGADPKTAAAEPIPPAVVEETAGLEPADAPSCQTQAAELRAFLTALVDPNAQLAPPWPTGDGATDERIEQARVDAREQAAALADPSAPSAALSSGINVEPDEELYRDCPQGLAALQAVGAAAPAQRATAFIEIADAVEQCDCQVDLAWLRASYYLAQRGPD